MSRISIAQLFEDKKEKLELTWIAGQGGGGIELSDEAIAHSGQGLIGHLNFIHPLKYTGSRFAGEENKSAHTKQPSLSDCGR